MAYTKFDTTTPDASSESINEVTTSTRENLAALRDAVITGAMVDFDMTPSGGTAEQPTTIKYNRGTSEYVKLALTWGTTGGEDGNVTQAIYSYSTDDSTYDTIGTLTISYDSDGNITGMVWS